MAIIGDVQKRTFASGAGICEKNFFFEELSVFHV